MLPIEQPVEPRPRLPSHRAVLPTTQHDHSLIAGARSHRPLCQNGVMSEQRGTAEIRVREHDLTWREVDDEVVVLDLDGQRYLSINASGVDLWKLAVEGT